jgi:hypothetical protein
MNIVVQSIFLFLCVGLPVAMIWGWIRWGKRARRRNLTAILSLVAFVLATASALLAITAWVYASAVGGFPFYDPRLLRIYRWGLLLSLSGLAVAIGGVWRPGPLRWHAPAFAFGTLLFWFLAAIGE